jgi:D-sedoheptulose 7-phosphate isomerase
LNRLGLLVIVTTNQPGIAKGKFTLAALEKITEKMAAAMAAEGARIDEVCSCLHHPEAVLPQYRLECGCRKPRPGLLLDAGVKWNLDLARSYMVGDGISDVLAGQAAGVTTLFVGSRKCYLCDELARQGAQPHFFVGTLSEAAEVIAKVEAGGIRSPAYGSNSSCCPTHDQHSAYPGQYIGEAIEILKRIDQRTIARTLELLIALRERGGRLFLLGVGGGAGHASHAVCDFRKIAQIEAYTPSDNVSELTARVNDEGWDTAYACWLRSSRLTSRDMVFVLSVGGGDAERNISNNLVKALQHAKEVGATVCGVVGRDGGFTAKVADACVVVPVVNPATITAHTESFQALIWHLLVSHPKLKASEMKWESVKPDCGASVEREGYAV